MITVVYTSNVTKDMMITVIGLVSAYAQILHFQPVILAFYKLSAPFIGITANILLRLGPVTDPYRCQTESIWTAVGLFPVESSR